MALLCFANFSKAEDVSIDDFTIKQGETIKVALTLTNTHSDLTAFSMTLTLPSGLKLIEAESTDRYDGSIVIGSPDTNMYHICGIQPVLETISGTEGTLLYLTISASETFQGGEGAISDVDFITTDRKHVGAANSSFIIDFERMSELFPGDANKDGIVDVLDVMTVVNKALGKAVSPFDMDNADTNGDGIIDVVDVMNIVQIVLTQ